MRVKANHQLVVSLTAVGDVEFSPEFLLKVKDVANQIGKDCGAKACNLDLHAKAIVVELHGVDLTSAAAIKKDLVQKIVLLAEHGPDGDLLDILLQRHPELKTHPKFSGLLSAFENMTGVVKDILAQQDGATLAEIQRRKDEGIEVQPEDLQSSGPRKRAMDTEERLQFRTAAIRGQTEEQQRAKPPMEESQIPEIYKQLAEKNGKDKPAPVADGATPKEFGPPLPGDAGNVFTRPAKK